MTTTATKRQPIPFGKYLLLDRVNIGGMAEVWRAKTFGSGGFERVVAIKRILPNIAEDEEFISMFIDEAKITVQLNHANIAQVYELSHIASSYFIAMEYISGKDLRAVFDRCRKKGEPAPIPLTCYVIGKCCEGLDYSHRQKDRQGRDMNIVHRDVSPQNLLISYDGEVKVIDFGIAKAAGKATKTQAGILKGKFGYMSPEQIRGLPLDRRSDVFAIGVCLYEMLTGERLFVGDSDFSVLEKVRKVEVLPPTTYNRKIPDALEKIVMKALAKDVDDRYQYGSELADDLQRFLITSEAIFSRKDLAQYMKATFAEEYDREKTRMAEYVEIRAPEGMALAAEMGFGVGSVPPPSASVPGSSAISGAPGTASNPTIPPMVTPTNRGNTGMAQRPGGPPALSPTGNIPVIAPAASAPANPPRMSPSMPRLTAVAPILTNEKEEHNSTVLVSGDEVNGGGDSQGSTNPETPALTGADVGTDATVTSVPPAIAEQLRQANARGARGRPPVPDEPPELMTEPVRASAMPGRATAFDRPAAVPPVIEPSDDSAPDLATVAEAPSPLARSTGQNRKIRPNAEMVPTSPGQNSPNARRKNTREAEDRTLPPEAPQGPSKTMIALIGGGIGTVILGIVIALLMRGGGEGLLFMEIPTDVTGDVVVNVNGKAVLDDDGKPMKGGPKLKRVPAGKLTVMITAPGYEPLVESVDVKEGNEYTRLVSKFKKKP